MLSLLCSYTKDCVFSSQVGARSLETGVWGTFHNVITNLSDIRDEDYKTKVSRSLTTEKNVDF